MPRNVSPGSRRTKRKRAFAATTKTLRLVGLGPSTTPGTNFASLLEKGDWKKIGISRKANDRRVRRLAMDELVQLTRREMGRTPFSPRRREDYFHNLEKLIIGQVYNYPSFHVLGLRESGRRRSRPCSFRPKYCRLIYRRQRINACLHQRIKRSLLRKGPQLRSQAEALYTV